MTFSRRYAERNAHLKHLRETIHIGIFGSFADEYRPVLYEARKFLRDRGFARVKLSYDLENDHPRNAQEHRDDYNLRMSDLLVDTSDIHIFYFFHQNNDPININ
ncbi:MAG: hypothetical protein KAW93_04040, partial [Methanogenium sp.]|nr:hypothetical protein [Methanogenium sp.]